ncbi:MAG: GNAT family N-acetyltransferase [Oscillospiraceae bacterium]
MQIRFAQEADLAQIAEIFAQLHAVHTEIRPDIYKNPGADYFRNESEKMLADENQKLFVAEADGVIAGYVALWVYDRESEIHVSRKLCKVEHLAVRTGMRRTGVGRRIMEFVAHYAAECNCRAIELGVWAENFDAVNYYAACGFASRIITLEKIL